MLTTHSNISGENRNKRDPNHRSFRDIIICRTHGNNLNVHIVVLSIPCCQFSFGFMPVFATRRME